MDILLSWILAGIITIILWKPIMSLGDKIYKWMFAIDKDDYDKEE